MDEYITRNNAISAVCFGCNQQFSNEPCEPSECTIRQSIMALPTADVVPRADMERWKEEAEQCYADTAIMREYTINQIFAEINAIKKEYASGDIDANELYVRLYMLEKKYTEEKT